MRPLHSHRHRGDAVRNHLVFRHRHAFYGNFDGAPVQPEGSGFIGGFSVGASFATVGISGIPALTPLAIVLRPFGLSYEVAVPLMIIIDPLGDMVRTMLNVGINCVIPTLAGGREALPTTQSSR